MSAGTICSRTFVTAFPGETVRAAAQRMQFNGVGSLVVVEPGATAEVRGVITDRDITLRCVAPGLDPDATLVAAVMTAPVVTVDQDTPVEEAVQAMARAGTRRLVVTGIGRKAVGILAVDDVLDLVIGELGPLAQLLARQRPHVPA
jgi:CBS domain-containing protein